MRRDRINNGTFILRHEGKLHYIGIGETPSGRTVLILLDNLHTRAIINDGQLLHDLILDY